MLLPVHKFIGLLAWGWAAAALAAIPLAATAAAPLPAPAASGKPLRPGSRAAPGAEKNPGRETEAQTIAKCLRDLRNHDPKVRLRAVMILGKYNTPQARAAVRNCLHDPDAAVRESALVSVTESRVPDFSAFPDVVRLLGDPDIHIRRIASSALRDLLVFSPMIMFTPGRTLRSQLSRPKLTPALTRQLNQALRSPDSIVRKNILALAPMIAGVLSPEAVESCLSDPSLEVRVLALRASALAVRNPQRLLAIARKAATAAEPELRRAAAVLLARLSKPGAEILAKMLDDPDAGVRTAAAENLARRGDPGSTNAVLRFLQSDANSAEVRRRVLWRISQKTLTAPNVWKCLEKLARHAPPALRAAALERLAWAQGGSEPVNLFLENAGSASESVRRAAMSGLLRRSRELRSRDLRHLANSPYPDVRAMTVILCGNARGDTAKDILEDLILDDAPEVRRNAIRTVANLRIGDWRFVLAQALRDSDETVRRSAAQMLMARARRDAQARKALEVYLAKPDDPVLAKFIADHRPSWTPGRPGPRLVPGRRLSGPTRARARLLPSLPARKTRGPLQH